MSIESSLPLEQLKKALNSLPLREISAKEEHLIETAQKALGITHRTSSNQIQIVPEGWIRKLRQQWGNDFDLFFRSIQDKTLCAQAILDCIHAGLLSIDKQQIIQHVRVRLQDPQETQNEQAASFFQQKNEFSQIQNIGNPFLQKQALLYALSEIKKESNIGYQAEARRVVGSQIAKIKDQEAQQTLIDTLWSYIGGSQGDVGHKTELMQLLLHQVKDLPNEEMQKTILTMARMYRHPSDKLLHRAFTPITPVITTNLLPLLRSSYETVQSAAARLFIQYFEEQEENSYHKMDIKAAIVPYLRGMKDSALKQRLIALSSPDEEVEGIKK